MAIYAYTKEVHDFVREYCTKMRDAELAEACNKACGTEFTQSKMKAFRANHGYKNGLGKLTHEEVMARNYPPGMFEYVRDNSWGVSSKEMAERVNEKFGTNFSRTGMKQFRQRHGIKSGVTGWYQKGHEPGTKGKTIEEICKNDPEKLMRVRATQFKIIKRLVPYQPERKPGRWKEHIFEGIMGGRPRALMCNQCNSLSLHATNFCPNCGADMREANNADKNQI